MFFLLFFSEADGIRYSIVIGLLTCSFFFFQAEDGIRDSSVTGVQTCALPIYLFGKQFKPEAGHLDRYADYLETALESFKDAGTKGSLRPFYLLCMSYHLRSVYPERWRGHWMRKSVHADIRDFVNAEFMAYDIDNDVTEDQIS